MNFRDLEYLVAVAELGHFGQAAARCHASQSALSLQLQKLEAELGVQLVERTNRRVIVTPAGHALVERARAILRARQEMLDDASLQAGDMPEEVSLGLIPTIAPYQISAVLRAMTTAYPRMTVRLVEDVTESLVQATARGSVDAAIIATAVDDTLLQEAPLGDDELLLAVSRTHPLAGKGRVVPKDIDRETLLLLKDGHCLSDQAAGFCAAHRAKTNRVSIASSFETLKALVRAGRGVTFIPRMALQGRGTEKGLAFIPMTPAPVRTIRIITRKTSRLGPWLVKALKGALVG